MVCTAVAEVGWLSCRTASPERAVTQGRDAMGEVSVKVDFDGTIVSGKGSSTDVIEASARAYLNALNRIVHTAQRTKEVGP